jgi:hypothetical protein
MAAQGDTNRKRTWSASNQSDAGSSGSGKRTGSGGRHSGGNGGGGGTGGGGRTTPRSSSWREHKDSRRFNEGGYGRQVIRPPPPTGAVMSTAGSTGGATNWMIEFFICLFSLLGNKPNILCFFELFFMGCPLLFIKNNPHLIAGQNI